MDRSHKKNEMSHFFGIKLNKNQKDIRRKIKALVDGEKAPTSPLNS